MQGQRGQESRSPVELYCRASLVTQQAASRTALQIHSVQHQVKWKYSMRNIACAPVALSLQPRSRTGLCCVLPLLSCVCILRATAHFGSFPHIKPVTAADLTVHHYLRTQDQLVSYPQTAGSLRGCLLPLPPTLCFIISEAAAPIERSLFLYSALASA